MIYCAYVRVSTDTQDVARQENEIKKWLGDTDHQVIWFKEQGVSGKVAPEKRPELSKCIDTARATKGTLIVADLDRFSRTCLLYTSPSPRDVEESRMPSSA